MEYPGGGVLVVVRAARVVLLSTERMVLMSTARAVACIITVLAVIWYIITIQHQLLAPPLRPASATDTLTHQRALGRDLQPSARHSSATTHSALNNPTYKAANTTLQVRFSLTMPDYCIFFLVKLL